MANSREFLDSYTELYRAIPSDSLAIQRIRMTGYSPNTLRTPPDCRCWIYAFWADRIPVWKEISSKQISWKPIPRVLIIKFESESYQDLRGSESKALSQRLWVKGSESKARNQRFWVKCFELKTLNFQPCDFSWFLIRTTTHREHGKQIFKFLLRNEGAQIRDEQRGAGRRIGLSTGDQRRWVLLLCAGRRNGAGGLDRTAEWGLRQMRLYMRRGYRGVQHRRGRLVQRMVQRVRMS